MNFIRKVKESKKDVLRQILCKIDNDCRSTTGRNIRKLLLENDVMALTDIDVDSFPYKEVPNQNEWKIGLVNEINMAKSGDLEVINLTPEELDEICEFVCCI